MDLLIDTYENHDCHHLRDLANSCNFTYLSYEDISQYKKYQNGICNEQYDTAIHRCVTKFESSIRPHNINIDHHPTTHDRFSSHASQMAEGTREYLQTHCQSPPDQDGWLTMMDAMTRLSMKYNDGKSFPIYPVSGIWDLQFICPYITDTKTPEEAFHLIIPCRHISLGEVRPATKPKLQ